MLFEKEKYYKYIRTLEEIKIGIYILIIFITMKISNAIGKGLYLGIIIGILISILYTIMIKIKIQKMKWEIDIYDMLKK